MATRLGSLRGSVPSPGANFVGNVVLLPVSEDENAVPVLSVDDDSSALSLVRFLSNIVPADKCQYVTQVFDQCGVKRLDDEALEHLIDVYRVDLGFSDVDR